MMNPINMLRPNRKITGMSAILLPFTEAGEVDWSGLETHVARTGIAGRAPAVNMDTGYANLINEATRQEVLQQYCKNYWLNWERIENVPQIMQTSEWG